MELETAKLQDDSEYEKSNEIDKKTFNVENWEEQMVNAVECKEGKLLELYLSGLKLSETSETCAATDEMNNECSVHTDNRGNFDPVENGKPQKKADVSNSKEAKNETKTQGTVSMEEGHKKLFSWLNKNMKIEMTDGRILIGVFLCTDRDGNVILGSCSEYINPQVCGFSDEPRILGLVMVPGRHIVSIHHDAGTQQMTEDRSNGIYG